MTGTRMTGTRTTIRRAALAAAATVFALGAGQVAVAGSAHAGTYCPAKEIAKVWYGGTSYVSGCEDVADRIDHLYYPGYMMTTAQRYTYDENVVFAQLRLRDLNYSPLVVDGYYGSQTAATVTRYQRNHGLVVDGRTGVQTWRELFGLGHA